MVKVAEQGRSSLSCVSADVRVLDVCGKPVKVREEDRERATTCLESCSLRPSTDTVWRAIAYRILIDAVCSYEAATLKELSMRNDRMSQLGSSNESRTCLEMSVGNECCESDA